jgi:aerobic carbon-monoxide dehydrogenase large subunit
MSSVVGPTRFVGQSVARVEDGRILTGRGRYMDDIVLPGMLEGVFARSDVGHARIVSVDAERARSMPGVVAVITPAELDGVVFRIQVAAEIPNYLRPVFHALADAKVRYVGDPVALVVAESRYLAEDARDAIEIEYEPLAAVVTMDQAADPELPALFEDVGSNHIYTETMNFGEPDAAFAEADRVVLALIDSGRVTHVPMEGRGGVADYQAGTDELTYHAGSQAPHALRQALSGLLGHPAERLRVVIPDIGGAFGQKAGLCREDLVVCAAARMLGRPVKWVEDRVENLAVAGHAREETIELEAAVKSDGTILGIGVKMRLNQGAYPLTGTPAPLFGWIARTMIGNAYRIDHMRWSLDVYASNKASYGAYRGPWAAETLAREILVDRIAHDLGLDPVDVRRRNLLTLDEQPRKMMTGPTIEGVASLGALERAVELIDYDGFREEQRRAREHGRLLGVGFSTYIEPAPGPPDFWGAIGFPIGGERAVARLEPDGHLTLMTTQAPHGQSHETTIAQVAATEFGIPMSHVRVLYGDTSTVPYSFLGTGGSRSATMASGSALHATRAVKQKALAYAGNMLEAAPEDLEIVAARIQVRGDPKSGMGLGELAQAVYFMPPEGEDPDLRSTAFFKEPAGGWSGGTHVCFVEIDAETGIVHIPRYEVIEDCGSLINPAVVDGQVRGGVAQGIGIALYEHADYNEEGTFVASTFLNYLVPTAMEIPTIGIEHFETPATDEVNYRGVGEGGTIAAPAAVLNAVSDALGGTRVEQLPLTPDRVMALIDAANGAS